MKKFNSRIKIYDNGGATMDRYTVVYLDMPERQLKTYVCLAMNGEPFHPQGFCQHSSAMLGKHLGKIIKFKDLPIDCQKAVIQDIGI